MHHDEDEEECGEARNESTGHGWTPKEMQPATEFVSEARFKDNLQVRGEMFFSSGATSHRKIIDGEGIRGTKNRQLEHWDRGCGRCCDRDQPSRLWLRVLGTSVRRTELRSTVFSALSSRLAHLRSRCVDSLPERR